MNALVEKDPTMTSKFIDVARVLINEVRTSQVRFVKQRSAVCLQKLGTNEEVRELVKKYGFL